MAIAAAVVLAGCLAAGLVWFFADPLNVPAGVLEILDQRASVVGMFTGMMLGVAGLIVAVVALRAQRRAESAPPDAEQQTRAQVPAERERSVAIAGDNVSTGDGARNVQMRAKASGQGRVYQAGGDQTINET
ncbi:hypothetical protein [Nonomuraea antri]|uniref:hypothetical protein n=1 Tax=Nonomuraea antri TaxID=2730852 RepID=UPI001569452C|nr:hypothetical protein [Nonomuraea antri]